MLRLVEALRGRFLVFDNDRYVGKSLIELGEFAEEQARFFELLIKPEAVVVEVGANIGAHTAVLANRARQVFAFEPQRRVFNALCGNMALNGLDNVECIRMFGGDRDEMLEIPAMDFDSPENNFGGFGLDSEGPKVDVVKMTRITIDCDFLKIDVESHEAEVLRGAAKMIARAKPVIYLENDRQEKSNELIGLVNEMGYKAYWHVTPLYRTDNHRKAPDPFANCKSVDMLCVPDGVPCVILPEAKQGERPILS